MTALAPFQAPDGLVVIVKRDCPTCILIEPVLQRLAQTGARLTVFCQDDPSFPQKVPAVVDDTRLEASFRLNIEAVPTLLRVKDHAEEERVIGWDREAWRAATGVMDLGATLPPFRPGCGSLSVGPGMPEILALRFGTITLASRRIEIAPLEDEAEACFDRGWTDGLPVVPPTEERVVRMLSGTRRDPSEVVGNVPPDLAECTVEKIAINAVMAGCKPEYLPVVLAAVEAAMMDEFCMHGLLATTWFAGPMVVVNGPVARRIGMNSGMNALGQGNRANATIGRALQLVIRNVGGGKPGGVDRATLGQPGKYTFCFAEDDSDPFWEPLAIERGFAADASTVTLFAGDGVQGVFDQKSRTPESLARTFAACLRTVSHPKLAMAADAFLVVSPEHLRVFREAGWGRPRLREELFKLLMLPLKEIVRGAGGIEEGLPETIQADFVPKFRPGGLNIVRAGGKAGLFSAIIGGWLATGAMGSNVVTREIRE